MSTSRFTICCGLSAIAVVGEVTELDDPAHLRTSRRDSAKAASSPTTSTTTSAPRPRVMERTALTRPPPPSAPPARGPHRSRTARPSPVALGMRSMPTTGLAPMRGPRRRSGSRWAQGPGPPPISPGRCPPSPGQPRGERPLQRPRAAGDRVGERRHLQRRRGQPEQPGLRHQVQQLCAAADMRRSSAPRDPVDVHGLAEVLLLRDEATV